MYLTDLNRSCKLLNLTPYFDKLLDPNTEDTDS